MTTFDLIATLVVLTALFSYFNRLVLRLPPAIGVMATAMGFSLLVVVSGTAFPALRDGVLDVWKRVDLDEAFLQGMLGFLLFSGSLHVGFSDLSRHVLVVAVLSTVGVLISTLVVGAFAWLVLMAFGIAVPLIECLLFGALISPTDPVAVLSILRKAGLPRDAEVVISGESLFNDGVGVVVFLGLLKIATGGQDFSVGAFLTHFTQEALGGALYGLLIGGIVYLLVRSVDDYHVEVFLSLALVFGGYSFARVLHVSGPIAMVVAGILMGNLGRRYALSRDAVERMDVFWELVDEFLNSVLFMLLGLQLIALSRSAAPLAAGAVMIPLVLLGRLASVAGPLQIVGRMRPLPPSPIRLLTWGGLRGGISVALALSLPHAIASRETIVSMTYVVVVFSILVQGLTIGPLSRKWIGGKAGGGDPPAGH